MIYLSKGGGQCRFGPYMDPPLHFTAITQCSRLRGHLGQCTVLKKPPNSPFVISYSPPSINPCSSAYLQGVRREHAHPVDLRQKQSNQPVFGQFLSNFIIQLPIALQEHGILYTPVTLSDLVRPLPT